MKKILVFAVVCICAFTVLFISLNKDTSEIVKENPYLTETRYKVAEYQGKIAVFKNNSEIPLDIFDEYVSALPLHDRELLEKGILAETEEELQKIIEDYTS